jgi:endonuclease VIII-like 1
MPELAEVKIMGDFINYIVSQEGYFEKIEKSPVSKVKTDLDVFEGGVFTMTANTRGKEMMITLEQIGGDLNGAVTKKLFVTLGMSGNFAYVRKDSENLEKVLKHAHLRFITTRGNYLVLHDVRRFAKWKWMDDWNKGRGYCPLTEFEKFREHLLTNWFKSKAFNVPINELLMNQSYFNGIGNYLRAEILHRLDINPFQRGTELGHTEIHKLIMMCHLCVRDAYALGGGQLKDWHNPNGTDGSTFNEWMKCYGSLSSVVDKTGRRFWFDPKWEIFIPEEYSQK